MNNRELKQIFMDTDFVHWSGTPEELRVAEYLKSRCERLGAAAHLEPFPVAIGEIEDAHVYADGKEIPAKGVMCCGSGEIEGELYYMPAQDKVSLAGAKDKIVLIDGTGVGRFTYQDLMKAGVKGILFQYGDLHNGNRDIDERDLRAHVVCDERKVLCAMLHVSTGVALVKNKVKRVRIVLKQREYEGQSHNVVAELPGTEDEWITLSAHYDSTRLSHGMYDNMTGCVGLLGVMEALKDKPRRCGLRFVFCGSEERGLLGSKAYVRDHAEELEKIALNINLDMIGSIMGKFLVRVSAEEKLVHYIQYMAAELGFPVDAKTGVYSSDSTPFADSGVPAISFARIAGGNLAPIHGRYDRIDVLSMDRLQEDIAFITAFTRRMATAVVCPVGREIPDSVKKELDEYLFRKRRG